MRTAARRALPFLLPSLLGLCVFYLGPLLVGLPFSVSQDLL